LNTAEFNEKAFIHGDLNSLNIIENGDNLTFLDFEFSGYGEKLFDIANFFCEWMTHYSPTGEGYPDRGEQHAFILIYLGWSSDRHCQINQVIKKIEKMQLVSHFFLGIVGSYYEPISA